MAQRDCMETTLKRGCATFDMQWNNCRHHNLSLRAVARLTIIRVVPYVITEKYLMDGPRCLLYGHRKKSLTLAGFPDTYTGDHLITFCHKAGSHSTFSSVLCGNFVPVLHDCGPHQHS